MNFVNLHENINEPSNMVKETDPKEQRDLKKGEKWLTMDNLFEYIHECPYNIKIRYVESEVEDIPISSTGPWIMKTLVS